MSKKVNITENQFKRLNFSVDELEWHLKYDIDKIDGGDESKKEILSKLNRDDINEAFLDYRYLFKSPTYDNPLTMLMDYNTVNEGLIHTYPLDETIRYLKDYFSLQDWQIAVRDANNGISIFEVLLPNNDENIKLFTKALNLCGYFISFPKMENLSKLPKNSLVRLKIEPKFQGDDSEKIRSEEKFLFHLTPKYYEKKIMSIGLSPRSKNGLLDYPDRVYLLRGTTPPSKMFELARRFKSLNDSHNGIRDNSKYVLFMIDVRKLPKNVTLFLDPNFSYGVYTMSCISPSSIVGKKEITIDE